MDASRRDRSLASRCRYWRLAIVLGCALTATGCHHFQPPPVPAPGVLTPVSMTPTSSQIMVNSPDRDFVWEQVVDVVDDYFKVRTEERVRVVGDLLTEGRLDTYPRGGSTLLEPWNHDSVNFQERLECTLQSIQRTAVIRVIPAEGGYLIDIEVVKDLEDVPRPETGAVSLANPAALRNDNSLHRVTNPVGGEQPTIGWIRMGRDPALEQVLLTKIQARVAGLDPIWPF